MPSKATHNKCRVPAEWEPHSATWLAWPYGNESFADRIPSIEYIYLRIISVLCRNERIRLIVRPQQRKEVQEKIVSAQIDLSQIDLLEADYADVWARDWGPTFVSENGKIAFVKWIYNAYGNKFPELVKDNAVVDQLPLLRDIERLDSNIVMEGGAIEVNGTGTVLTTEETLLNKNRNAELTREQIEQKIHSCIGTKKMIWLKRGLLNDHTDGHIDEIARFVSADTIIYAWADTGVNHDIMSENLEILKNATDSLHSPFKLIPLPLPSMQYGNGESAPVSYCNFYIGNGVVLVPQFDHPNDSQAREILADTFPGREIIGIDSTDLIYGGGGIHCITQQEPVVDL